MFFLHDFLSFFDAPFRRFGGAVDGIGLVNLVFEVIFSRFLKLDQIHKFKSVFLDPREVEAVWIVLIL